MKLLSNDYSRRTFLKATSAAAGGLALGGFTWPALAEVEGKLPGMAVADLPKGTAPKPVLFPHFPSRLHAFVWRNWPLVTPERMARVVGARSSDIVRLGRAMGLGDPPHITRLKGSGREYWCSFTSLIGSQACISFSPPSCKPFNSRCFNRFMKSMPPFVPRPLFTHKPVAQGKRSVLDIDT
jgi:TAT (twin-arginine translocation) pathway signal sequence